jgi:hypothetical protein
MSRAVRAVTPSIKNEPCVHGCPSCCLKSTQLERRPCHGGVHSAHTPPSAQLLHHGSSEWCDRQHSNRRRRRPRLLQLRRCLERPTGATGAMLCSTAQLLRQPILRRRKKLTGCARCHGLELSVRACCVERDTSGTTTQQWTMEYACGSRSHWDVFLALLGDVPVEVRGTTTGMCH